MKKVSEDRVSGDGAAEPQMHNRKESRVYEIEDIQKILHIGRTKAYEFIKKVYREQKPFKVIKIGNLYRIPKTSFDHWLNDSP